MAERDIKAILSAYNISIDHFEFNSGDFIDEYVLTLSAGTRFSKLESLADDIARELRTKEIIPINDIENGVVKLQVNKDNPIVLLDDCINDIDLHSFRVPIIFGRDINGSVVVYDLVDTLHTLICGATKSGKSVMLRSMVATLLRHNNAKLVLIDPKLVEFKHFEKSASLACDVITQPQDAVKTLNRLVDVMEKRYEILANANVVNIEEYHDNVADNDMPYIIVICDELADLMMVSGKAIEEATSRLAAKARAVGIYLIFATQRASADVITGNIKINFSTRVCFRVPTAVDSRVIIDQDGANKLKGYGDGLLSTHLESSLTRFQGAFISLKDIPVVTGEINGKILHGISTVNDNLLLNRIIQTVRAYGSGGASLKEVARALHMNSVVGTNNILEELETSELFCKVGEKFLLRRS